MRDHYNDNGYFVTKATGKTDPATLIAYKMGKTILVKCALNGEVKGRTLYLLTQLADSLNARAVIASKGKEKIKLETIF